MPKLYSPVSWLGQWPESTGFSEKGVRWKLYTEMHFDSFSSKCFLPWVHFWIHINFPWHFEENSCKAQWCCLLSKLVCCHNAGMEKTVICLLGSHSLKRLTAVFLPACPNHLLFKVFFIQWHLPIQPSLLFLEFQLFPKLLQLPPLPLHSCTLTLWTLLCYHTSAVLEEFNHINPFHISLFISSTSVLSAAFLALTLALPGPYPHPHLVQSCRSSLSMLSWMPWLQGISTFNISRSPP